MRSPVYQLNFDPVQSACDVIEGVRETLRDTLSKSLTDLSQIDAIVTRLQIEAGVFLALNREFRKSRVDFETFARQEAIPRSVVRSVAEAGKGIERLYEHQEQAIRALRAERNVIIATGTGSGKTESFLLPILSHCVSVPLRSGTKAILIYPMNALAGDQVKRIDAIARCSGVTVGMYVGKKRQGTKDGEWIEPEIYNSDGLKLLTNHEEMIKRPPDILVTNYVMLDRMLTSRLHYPLLEKSKETLRYIVLDELHSYRGSCAADLSFLLRRLRHLCEDQAQSPVIVGCSATLADFDGPLAAEMRRYVTELLGIGDFEIVRPTFEYDQPFDDSAIVHQPPDQTELPSFVENVPESLKLVEKLTGRRMTRLSLISRNGEVGVFSALRNTAVFRLLANRLRRSSASLEELESLVRHEWPCSEEWARRLVQSYLTAIAFANSFRDKSPPLLDFRVHMFLRELSGYLKMCVFCQTYHPGEEDTCISCGASHLFFVYRHSPDKAVARVRDRRLCPSLVDCEQSESKRDYFVLVDPKGKSDGQLFRLEKPNDRGYSLQADGSGQVQLLFLEDRKVARDNRIPLAPGFDKDPYLARAMRELLHCKKGSTSKLLAFYDDRQGASRRTLALRDGLVSRFFEEFVRFTAPVDGWSLERACRLASERLEKSLELLSLPVGGSAQLLADFPVWFYRTLLSGTFGEHDLFVDGAFDESQMEILDVFLRERAIDMRYEGDPPRNFIAISLRWALTGSRIHCRAISQSDKTRAQCVSLAQGGTKYAGLIRKYGSEKVEQIIEELCECGVLVRSSSSEGVMLYALKPSKVTLVPGSSTYPSFDRLSEDLLLFCDLHSSEIDDKQRQQVEHDFDNGILDVLIATPTLEMGVDISDLSKVLMVGVPPSESSYVQRAGRAGRGDNRYAIIATMCRTSRPRDIHFFHRPMELIGPHIVPPMFDLNCGSVWKSHLHAVVVAQEGDRLARFAEAWESSLPGKLAEAQRIFPDFDVKEYLKGEFLTKVTNVVSRKFKHKELYDEGFFPVYGFRRDQIDVVDTDGGEILSRFTPEISYRRFIPGRRVWVSGDEWVVTSSGCYDTDESGVREYRSIHLRRNVLDAAPHDEDEHSSSQRTFRTSQSFVTIADPVSVCVDQNCEITLLHEVAEQTVVSDGSNLTDMTTYKRGYVLKRQAMIFRYPVKLFRGSDKVRAAIAAISGALVQLLRIDASDLAVVDKITPAGDSNEEFEYIALYDGSGLGSFVAEHASRMLRMAIRQAAEHLTTCKFDRGCPDCLRALQTQFLAMDGKRDEALEVCNFMLGTGYLVPSCFDSQAEQYEPDAVMRIISSGENVEVRVVPSVWSGSDLYNSDNLFRLIQAGIEHLPPNVKDIVIVSRLSYIVDAFNGKCAIDKDASEFKRCLFDLLRFRSYQAIQG
jgi:hypothetical protein